MSKLLKASVLILSLVSFSNQISVAQTDFLTAVAPKSTLVSQVSQIPQSNTVSQTSTPITQQPLVFKPSTLYFNVDEEITQMYVNGNSIMFQFNCNEAGVWDKTHSQSFYLFGGDKLTIVGKVNKRNTIGILGTLHYFNKYGIEKIINTGTEWTCDDKPAKLKGKNDGKVSAWPNMKLIDTNAQWIWSDKPLQVGVETSCTYLIPCDL